ncbi:MAG: outer membrane lipoprotein carrier protein LolA [Lentisphaerae bacterium]|nr:outer membrane lipoprotein carrier protein LolA [Lentisphaerota bacterium]
MHYMRIIALLLLCPLSLLRAADTAVAATAAPPTLAEFAAWLRPLAAVRSVQAEYRQTRLLRSLNFSLSIHGHMAQEQGRRLLWATTSPMRSTCIFSEDSFQQWDAETGKVTSLSAADMPWLKVLFNCQKQWLSGDLDALATDFSIEPLDDHTLRLTPRRQEFQLFFTQIEMRFRPSYDAIARLVFSEKNGDSMQMDFFNIRNNEPIPEQLWMLPPK